MKINYVHFQSIPASRSPRLREFGLPLPVSSELLLQSPFLLQRSSATMSPRSSMMISYHLCQASSRSSKQRRPSRSIRLQCHSDQMALPWSGATVTQRVVLLRVRHLIHQRDRCSHSMITPSLYRSNDTFHKLLLLQPQLGSITQVIRMRETMLGHS